MQQMYAFQKFLVLGLRSKQNKKFSIYDLQNWSEGWIVIWICYPIVILLSKAVNSLPITDYPSQCWLQHSHVI